MNAPNGRNIYIYEHPESKLRFLETALAGHDWRAIILYSPAELPQLQKTENALRARGYGVSRGVDTEGHPTLSVHHFGKGTEPGELFRELGLVQGTGKLIGDPAMALGKHRDTVKRVGHWFAGSVTDPARANGVVNTTGEIFLSLAGIGGSKTGKWSDRKNLLQSFAGMSWLAQSLIYLGLARNNEDQALQKIEKKIARTAKAGGDITQIEFDAEKDRETNSIGNRLSTFVRRYPVQIGAIFSNVGMLAYIGHAIYERKYHLNVLSKGGAGQEALEAAAKYVGSASTKGLRAHIKTGFGKDITGALLSLTGWTVLLMPPLKPKTALEFEKADDESTPARVWRKFRENTPIAAGLITLGASTFRLMGANSKGNVVQQIGEKIYIAGDIALMFTNSHEYGGDAKLNPEKLTEKIMYHVNHMPVLMGKKAQEDFVEHVVKYWVDKHCADIDINPRTSPLSHQKIQNSAVELKQALIRKMRHGQTERLEHLHEAAADIITRFPAGDQEAVAQALAATLSKMPWVRASVEEVKNGILEAYAKQAATSKLYDELPSRRIARDVSTMLSIVPHIDMVGSSTAIYDALAPFMVNKQLPSPHVQNVVQVASGIAAANDEKYSQRA